MMRLSWKHLAVVVWVFAVAGCAHGQVTNPQIIPVTTAPSGACGGFPPTQMDIAVNPPSWWGCNNVTSMWVQLNSGATAGVTSLTGTANQVAVSASTGGVTISIPTNPTLPGTTTGTFSGNLTGNVTGNVSGTAATITGQVVAANLTVLTTSQDILYRNGAALARLPIVTDGTCLGATAGAWASVACSGGGMTIGGAVSGGTAGQVLFVGTGPVLAQSSGFAYNDTTKFAGLIGGVTVGQSSTATGQVKFNGTTSGTVTLTTADAAGTWTMKLPSSGGTNGFCLTTDGTGVTSWSSCAAGSGYATIDNNGTPVTQRTTVNFIPGTGISQTIVDNSGSSRTDATFSVNSATAAYVTSIQQGNVTTVVSATGNDSYVGSPSIGTGSGPTALTTGMQVCLYPDVNNTGAATFNYESLGVKNIKKADGTTDPANNDIVASTCNLLTYNGTSWVLPAVIPSSAGTGTVTSIATTSPITGGTITSTGTIACATCVTSAAALTSNAVVIGGGGQASSTISGDSTTTHALFATAGAPAFRAIAAGDLPANTKIRGIGFTIGDPGNSSALTVAATTTSYVTVPFACTISAYNLLIDAGTITVKFWKVATGTAIPTSSNSISTSGVGIATGTAIHSTTVSDFTTTTVSANDILAMNVTAVATAKFVNGVLECDQ